MTLPTLYTLAAEYREAAEHLSNLDLSEDVIADTLEGMAGELETKATNVAFVIKNLESLAGEIKAAESEMARRRKAIENRAGHVREYLKSGMIHAGIDKIECPYFKLALRDNPPAVVIDLPALIPVEYMHVPELPPLAPNKKAIAEAIKAGREVPGCHLERGKRLEIKV